MRFWFSLIDKFLSAKLNYLEFLWFPKQSTNAQWVDWRLCTAPWCSEWHLCALVTCPGGVSLPLSTSPWLWIVPTAPSSSLPTRVGVQQLLRILFTGIWKEDFIVDVELNWTELLPSSRNTMYLSSETNFHSHTHTSHDSLYSKTYTCYSPGKTF